MLTTLLAKAFFCVFLGLAVGASLSFAGQKWSNNVNYISTFCILPVISFFITNAISGNLALSLGMVGALSIVRFRHPVRSSLELSVYFLLVTIGIAVISSPLSAALLVAIFATIMSLQRMINYKSNSLRMLIPALNVDTTDKRIQVDIISSKSLDEIKTHERLVASSENFKSSTFAYKLLFKSDCDVADLDACLSNYDSIIDISKSISGI